jgi:hypothetical protein
VKFNLIISLSFHNVDIREHLEVQSIEEINAYQKNWKEHVGRMQEERLPKLALKYQPAGKRNRSHLKNRWKSQFLEEN